MRKYLFNGSIVGALVTTFTTVRTGSAGPKDWRFYLSLVAAVATLAVAVGTVHKESKKIEVTGRGF
jgi:hypothetical protein